MFSPGNAGFIWSLPQCEDPLGCPPVGSYTERKRRGMFPASCFAGPVYLDNPRLMQASSGLGMEGLSTIDKMYTMPNPCQEPVHEISCLPRDL